MSSRFGVIPVPYNAKSTGGNRHPAQPTGDTMNDDRMIRLAAARAPVVINRDGQQIEATLVAWKPWRTTSHGRTRRQIARVQFLSGRTLTVPVDIVITIDPT